MHTVIHWFRRDLRISDNTALHAAWSRADCLVPVYLWDDEFLRAPEASSASVAFLLNSLAALAKNLGSLGHRLIIRHGPPAAELVKLARDARAAAVSANRDYEPQAVTRDRIVATELYQAGVYFETFKDEVLWEGRDILNQAGDPYTVFTPYAKAWRSRPRVAPVPRLGRAKLPADPDLRSLPLPTDSAALGHPLRQTIFQGGEHTAQAALQTFVQQHLSAYHRTRDFPGNDRGTSKLSAHLRWGTVNIRTILAKLPETCSTTTPAQLRGVGVWETELIWREFYRQILANFPQVAAGCFRPEYEALAWSGTDAQFDAWCTGQTGYPIVDAAMRCLNATGWMHNRLRMIVAMFLTKDLLISWQRGERYFMRQLVDGDLAANNGGWQWSAGTGTDAAPYFRIFNPLSQGAKFDPAGAFVRRWIPELAEVDAARIHRPWEDSLLLQRTKYPPPLVDHARQRQRCLAMFQAVRTG